MARTAKKSRSPATQQEKREQLYKIARSAFEKLEAGESLTEKEARILQNCHNSFRELERVFRPSIKKVLDAQARKIADLLEDADIEDDE